MNEKEKKELAANLKRKRYRKYILTVLAIFICVSAVAGLSIEGKDAKLPDGQGNIVTDRQDDLNLDADADSDAGKEEIAADATDKSTESSTDGSEAKKEAEKQAEELSRLTEKEKIDPSDVKVDNSEDFTASNGGNAALRPKEPKPVTVTLEIRCDTLSSDMSKLENPAIKGLYPGGRNHTGEVHLQGNHGQHGFRCA